MKVYSYYDGDLLKALPMSLEQIERARVKLPETFTKTDDPRAADVFWMPIDIGHIEAYHGGTKTIRDSARRLPYWKGNERRHIFYFCSDGAEPTGLPSIMFRQSFYRDRADENCIAWPYAVEDFGSLVTDDFSQLQFDVSFVGSRVSHKCRIESFDSVKATYWLSSWLDDSKAHWGSIERTEQGAQRKQIFIESMSKSKLVLAARGGGLSCYRFFEAMSAGRIPVLLADDWELPMKELIDWRGCMVQIPERDATNAGPILFEWLKGKTDRELTLMGQTARTAWANYLAPVMWPQMMAWYVGKILR